MHRIAMSPATLESIMQRRGKLHAIESLDPKRCALLVIDLQNGFMLPGYPLAVPVALEIVPNVNRLAARVRSSGGTVVWIRMNTEGQHLPWSVFYERMRPEAAAASVGTFSPGNDGFALHAGLDIRDGDPVVDKKRFSAFIRGSSDLDEVLHERGIDTLIITGTVTNICCESTARDAMMLNYRIVFVSDANAALSDDAHNATLATMITTFGDVYATDEVIALL
jgi:ureidoacrylate peracid hydrolase